MTLENNLINKVKSEFDEVIALNRDAFREEIKKFAVEVFLYNNYFKFKANVVNGKIADVKTFKPENARKEDPPAFSIIDTEKYFPKKEFVTIGSLFNNIIGDQNWIDGFGFLTYAIEAKEFYIEIALKEVEKKLIKEKKSNKPAALLKDCLDDVDFSAYILEVVNQEFDEISKIKLLDAVNELSTQIMEERINDTIKADMEVLKNEREKENFNILKDELDELFGYNNALGYDVPKKLSKNNKIELEILQFWSVSKPFQDLKLINAYYPFSSDLKNYKWLNEDIYKQKLTEYKESKNTIKDVLKGIVGNVKKGNLPPFKIRQVYELYKNILNIKGDKFVYLVSQEGTPSVARIFIDEFGRVGTGIKDYFLFLDLIQEAIVDGYVFIKTKSDEEYKLTFSDKEVTHNYNYIYGIFLRDLYFDGMTREEVEEFYKRGYEDKADFFMLKETDQFKDFNI